VDASQPAVLWDEFVLSRSRRCPGKESVVGLACVNIPSAGSLVVMAIKVFICSRGNVNRLLCAGGCTDVVMEWLGLGSFSNCELVTSQMGQLMSCLLYIHPDAFS